MARQIGLTVSRRLGTLYTVTLNTTHRPMTALRASYSIAPEVLQRFNALVPTSERSKTVQSLMESILEKREKNLEAIAAEFATHPDFAEARADGLLWDATSLDGLAEPTSQPAA